MITIPSVNEIQKLDKQISAVMWYITYHKAEIIRECFPDSTPDYQLEWYSRGTYEFWCHLDNGNRHIVIRLALEFYNQ